MSELDGDPGERGPARADPSIMIFLALFTLLLAFFILLNSVATREASRAAALMQSLGAAFAGEAREAAPAAGPESLSRDALRLELGSLLDRALPEAASVPDDRNGALRVVAPLSRLFRENLAEFHTKGAPLLAGIAELLARRRTDGKLEAEIRIGFTPGAPDDLALRRAGALAREMSRLGAPSRAFAMGLQAAEPASAELVFRLIPASEPAR